MTIVRRRFADVADRQVHFRTAGEGAPRLLMLHGSPGSSRQLTYLIEGLASSTSVLAPDTPGYGDTALLAETTPENPPTIADFAAATLEFLDSIGVCEMDVFGTHTGGAIAIELALLAPDRIRRLIVDGVGHFSESEKADHLAQYALPMTPDRSGAYLATAFAWVRDLFLFWPWYLPDVAHRREAGLPEPAVLHALLVEILKNIDTYHLGYRAAFAHPAVERLALVSQPTLLMAQDGDPLLPHTRAAAAQLPHMRFVHTTRQHAATLIGSFLA